MSQSETIGKLAEALSKAQGEIVGATKESDNPYFKSRYADLAAVWEACREPLSKNGLAVIQTTESDDAGVAIVTTLVHSSGEWIRGRLVMKPQKAGPQELGSVISYARRYSLAAMVGVYQVDDDAEAAMDRKPKIKEPQAKEIRELLEKTGTDEKGLLSWLGIDSINALPASEFERAKRALETKAKRNGTEEHATASA